tara:strand:- start:49 stop:246 length:198 start_codon:yes stop_codon:yes gene_type:complete
LTFTNILCIFRGNKKGEKMLVSKCHKAKPWFSLGVAHGVVLNKKDQFVGKCGKCHKDTVFNKGKK